MILVDLDESYQNVAIVCSIPTSPNEAITETVANLRKKRNDCCGFFDTKCCCYKNNRMCCKYGWNCVNQNECQHMSGYEDCEGCSYGFKC